jgi:hypothetical protein
MGNKRCLRKNCNNMAKYGKSNLRTHCFNHVEDGQDYNAKSYCSYENCEKKLLLLDKVRGSGLCEEHHVES